MIRVSGRFAHLFLVTVSECLFFVFSECLFLSFYFCLVIVRLKFRGFCQFFLWISKIVNNQHLWQTLNSNLQVCEVGKTSLPCLIKSMIKGQ